LNQRLRAASAAIFLTASILACTLGQTPPAPAVETTPPPVITDTPPPSPTPDIETIDDFFARCPTADEIAMVDGELSMSFEFPLASERLFEANPDGSVDNEPDPSAGQLVCTAAAGSADLTAIQKRAYQSALVMRLLHFTQPLPWTDLQLYDWFVNAIDGLRFRDDIEFSFCCDPTGVINIQVRENAYLAFSDRFMDPSYAGGLVYTMILYIHEARHNEGFGHTCPSGDGNDKTVAEMGAWAVQYYTMLWLAQYSDHTYLSSPGIDPNYYRQALLDEANYTRSSRFCEDPVTEPTPTLIP
jgi:hypothetical protein